MNNLSVYHSAHELLKELHHLIEDLKNDQGNTSQLELDLMKEKIRDIYDQLCDVKIIKPTEKQKEVKFVVEPESQPGQEKKQAQDTVQEFDKEIEEKEQTETESPVSVEKKESDQQLSPSGPILNLFEEPLGNKEINDKKSAGEQITDDKPIESIGEVIQSKNIVNLKLAIGINEKFFFLNELFEGNMKEYNETIDALDQKDTYKEAMEYLVLLLEKKSWDVESEAYMQIKGFLERKFN
ncbi:MAG: hypothetical protein K8R74_00495 [Bacteroidales bacterium]|nr:hypothetical protein [Bacteroidales bacterium]